MNKEKEIIEFTAENGIIKARLTSEPVKALLLTKTKI